MLPTNPLYARIHAAAKGLTDPELRKKLHCLLRGFKIKNVELACRQFGVSRSIYYVWLNRLKENGFSADSLRPLSRRPHSQPRQIEGGRHAMILSLRKEFHYGPARIAWYVTQQAGKISSNGVYKVLQRADVPFRKRRDKKPNRHTKRYELDRPGQGFQLDIKYVPFRVEQQKAYVFSAIDDCTRWRFSYLYRHLGYDSAIDFVQRLIAATPFSIDQIQTDNGIEFTNRFLRSSPDYEVEHPFGALLRTLKILHRLIPPGIKELNGKIERSHKTDDQEFYWRQPPSISFPKLQRELERWIYDYNHHRPHSSLNMRTPGARLNDFGILPQTTQQTLATWQQERKTRPSLALRLAEELKKRHLNDSYFRNQVPIPKKRRISTLDRAMAFAYLSNLPEPSLCNMCGDTTA